MMILGNYHAVLRELLLTKNNQIKTILSEAVDLQSEIENDEADMIKQEKL